MEEQTKKGTERSEKEKKQRPHVTPITEPALPLLLSTVAMAICFIALLINKFIYPVSKELLAPVILQLIALVIPAYLVIMLTDSEKSMSEQMRGIGFRALRPEYIFFVLFAALFAAAASLILTLAFGGAHDAARGLTVLGCFTAGVNEYSVSLPYIILAYAVIPSFAEEFLFRGVILSRLEKVSFPFAAIVSTVLFALSGFSLGGFIPCLFVGVLSVFVLYTTRSLWSCIILHLLFNLYRLFLEANICAYFLSLQNNLLLIITVALALCLSSLLFFSEGARIFRKRAVKIAKREARSEKKTAGMTRIPSVLRSALAYRPTLIFFIVCICLFAATVIINYLT
jgi:membrane protease YdiL (CAAX protease family)